MVSGVFYTNVPTNSGDIVFSDPRGVNPYYPQESSIAPFDDHHRMTPKLGDLILFPPWLPHRVESAVKIVEQHRGHAAHDEVYNQIPQEHLTGATMDETPLHKDPNSLRVSISFNILGSWRPTANVRGLNLKKGNTRRSIVGNIEKNTIPLTEGTEKRMAREPQQQVREAGAVDEDWAHIVQNMRTVKGKSVRGLSGDVEYNQRPEGFPSRHGKD